MKKRLSIMTIAAVLLASTAGPAYALLTPYFGALQNSGKAVSGAPLIARTAFLSQLTGVGTETFSSQVTGATSPLPISFPGSTATPITATLTGDGFIDDADVTGGRFNTTGAVGTPNAGKWWEVSGDFTITFSSAISAFGFYGTDMGDYAGNVTISLRDELGAETMFTLPTVDQGGDVSLIFWGFVDSDKAYTQISFGNTAGGQDVFGFDDMTVGDRQQVNPTPEPATLALVGLSLLGLGAARRRRG